MSRFKDRIVWITGAGTGIGRATARMFAAEGATIALMGRRAGMLEGVYDEITSLGGHGEVVALDVADRGQVQQVGTGLLERWGRVDVLVNNAGVNVPQRRLRELTGETWDLIIGVNLTGAFNMIHAVLPPMREQGGGLIVNISSMAGKQASGLSGAAYTASKHGFNGLSLSVNAEEWQHGIRATAICPGEVNTEIMDKRPIPVARDEREQMMQPEDVAEAVRFLTLLHPRTNVPEMLMVPTRRRPLSPEETR